MFGKRPWKMAAAAAAIALLAAGCSSGSSDDTEAAVQQRRDRHRGAASTCSRRTRPRSSGSEVLASLFYPLVKFDAKNEPRSGRRRVDQAGHGQQGLDDQAQAGLHLQQRRAGHVGQLHQRLELRRLRAERPARVVLLRPDRRLRRRCSRWTRTATARRRRRAADRDQAHGPEEGRRPHLHGDAVGAVRRLGVGHGLRPPSIRCPRRPSPPRA